MRCESGFVSAPEIVALTRRTHKINSVRKTRLQLLLCKTSIDIFEKTLLTLFWKCTYELSRSRFTPQFAIFAEPLRKRKANGKRRSFRVRGSNVEAEVAEVVFRN